MIRSISRTIVQVVIILGVLQLLLFILQSQANPDLPDQKHLTLLSAFEIFDGKQGAYGYKAVAQAIFITLNHSLLISLFSIGTGLVLGLATGWSERIKFLTQGPVDFFRGVPVTIMLAVALIPFSSSSDLLLVTLCSIPCIATTVFFIHEGIFQMSKFRKDVFLLNHGPLGPLQYMQSYLFPILMPYFLSSTRIVVSYSLVVSCAVEMLEIGSMGSSGRLLSQIQSNQASIAGPPMAVILILGLVSFCLCKSLETIERWAKSRAFDA